MEIVDVFPEPPKELLFDVVLVGGDRLERIKRAITGDRARACLRGYNVKGRRRQARMIVSRWKGGAA